MNYRANLILILMIDIKIYNIQNILKFVKNTKNYPIKFTM